MSFDGRALHAETPRILREGSFPSPRERASVGTWASFGASKGQLLVLAVAFAAACRDGRPPSPLPADERPGGESPVVITELLAVNASGIRDARGQTEDWVELYNRSLDPVDLAGWSLTDSRLNLTKWRFPAGTTVAPGGFLVVFASGRETASADGEGSLHADFKLSGAGEYLALVEPDGRTVASEYDPYPEQDADVSFGRALTVTRVPLVGLGSPASMCVPQHGKLGTRWTEASFTEGERGERWLAGSPAVGFDSRAHESRSSLRQGLQLHLALDATRPGRRDAPLAGADPASDVGDLIAEDSSSSPGYHGQVVGDVRVAPGIIGNAFELAGRGAYAHVDLGNVLDPEMDSFTISLWFRAAHTEGAQTLIAKGNQTPQYEGWRIYLQGSRVAFRGLQSGACPVVWCTRFEGFGQISAPGSVAPGTWHHVAAVIDREEHVVRGFLDGTDSGWSVLSPGVIEDRLLEGPSVGSKASLQIAGLPVRLSGSHYGGLIDDVAIWSRALTAEEIAYIEAAGRAGLSLPPEPTPGLHGAIVSDIETAMWAQNSSVYLRIPFELPEPLAPHDAVKLAVTYDAGFVAYLNGEQVTRRNAPAALGHGAAAEGSRTGASALEPEIINITAAAADALVPGSNLLALHGLNETATDPTALVSAELWLEHRKLGAASLHFPTPTPGQPNGHGAEGVAPAVAVSRPHGLYDAPFALTLSSENPDAVIRYTTDGTEPGPDSPTYTEPLDIRGTTCLRARAFLPGRLPGPTITQSFIFPRQVLRQPDQPPGFPDAWAQSDNEQMRATDYGMDPRVVSDPVYGPSLLDALRAIPTVSLVAAVDDLFGYERGIYANPTRGGVAWERPVSVELIEADGRPGFQVDAGVRMHGGGSRSHIVKKHSLRLKLRKRYGPGKLVYPLFGADAAVQHDTLVLRAGFNNTWHTTEARRAQYIVDQWVRDTQLAMGHPAAHGTFVHLYLNGLYWGVYNLTERPDRAFAAAYLGGDADEWDALNAGRPSGDSRMQPWIHVQQMAAAGLTEGHAYAAFGEHVDVENLADYMLLNFYASNHDWDMGNWYAARRRQPGARFKFFCWDAERSLETVYADLCGRDNFNAPSRLFQQLGQSSVFRALLVERVRKHFGDDGALSPQRAAERYRRLAERLELPIVAESARWGDASHMGLYTRDNQWVVERDRILEDYFPQRGAVLVATMQKAGLLDPGESE